MKNVIHITILLSLFMATLASAVFAQGQPETQTISVIGTGRISGENVSAARNQAISDCLVTAISMVASDLLQQQVFIQSFPDINRLLFLEADKFVQGYRVLTEDTTGRVYRVMVQATVSVEKIRELLIQNDILSQNTTPLKVLLLIAEQDLENHSFRYWWGDDSAETTSEAPLAGALHAQGFMVVDHRPSWSLSDNFDTLLETPVGPQMSDDWAAAPAEREPTMLNNDPAWPVDNGTNTLSEALPGPGPVISDDQATSLVEHEVTEPDRNRSWPPLEAPPGPEMSNSQAVDLGIQFHADVVIVGTATVGKASNVLGNELRSFEGVLSVRAVRTDSGAVLAEIDHKFITADADDIAGSHRALTEAGIQTGELLAWKIQAAWQQTLEKGPTATAIKVEGDFKLPHLVAFRRILSGMQGVGNLQTTEMTPKETILSLDYEGTAKELAEALLLNSFDGFGVHISEVTPEAIRLSLVPN